MRPGKLRERITVEQALESRRAAGGVATRWKPVASMYAAVVPISGREFFTSNQRNASVTHRIEIRAREGIRPKMRVFHKDRVFNITAILNVEERDREMHLMCEEIIGREAAA